MMSQQKRPIDRIAPDDLVEQVDGAETVDDAIDHLHKFGNSTTKESNIKRCPECLTKRVYNKSNKYDVETRKDGEYYCSNRHHFDDPVFHDSDEVADNDGDDQQDSFDWVDPDDLAEPPITRQLAELDDRALTALAVWLYRPWAHADDDPSYRDLSTIFPYSRVWIGDRIRAWKDGEHRDLVRDPRPRVRIGGAAE